MKKTDRNTPKTKAPALTLVESLADVVRQEMREFVVAQGMQALALMLEQEREALCGPAYARGREGSPRRAGSASGELVLGGRRARVRRPRVRDDDGEVALPSWSEFASEDPSRTRPRADGARGLDPKVRPLA